MKTITTTACARLSEADTPIKEIGGKFFHICKFDEAELCCQLALDIEERVLGPNDPAGASSLSHLATVLYCKRKFSKVEPLDRRVLSIGEKAYGAKDYETLRSLNNLPHTLWKLGDYDAAEKLFERLLAGCESVLGTDHDKTLDAMMHLSCWRRWKEGIRMVWNPDTHERW